MAVIRRRRIDLFAAALIWGAGLAMPAGARDAAEQAFIDGLEAYDGGRYAETVELWQSAAEACHAPAMAAPANLYVTGEGVDPDAANAVVLYRRAAELGHAVAQANLGDHLARGDGVDRDTAEAMMWLNLAARASNAWAEARLRSVAADSVPANISEAERLADAFEPRNAACKNEPS